MLRAVVVLTFRCVVIGGQQGAVLERVFGEVARQVSGSSSGGDVLRMVLQGLKRAYPSDETFKAAFRVKTLVASDGWSRGVIVYVLRALQEGVADVDMSATRADSVEHVLPQNPKSGWDAFDDVQVNDLAHRLGNMVLIPASLNKDVGNTSWEAKRAAFVASGDARAVEFAESFDEWTPQAVQARQTEMAKQATAVWRIDFPT